METSALLEADEVIDAYDMLNFCINKIGMGRYQWNLFLLCGLGWAADNMVFQCIAAILPLLIVEFELSGWHIGIPSSCLYVGSMFGALFWGICSDAYGRKPVFTATLAVAGASLIFCSLLSNFVLINFLMLVTGFGIGGNLPIDGSLFLEFIPQQNQSLLALMSIFWPVGQIVTALLALTVIPSNSCNSLTVCNPANNYGWRYLLFGVGALIILMLVARLSIMTFHESPKNLTARGYYKEAIQVMKTLAKENDVQIELNEQELKSGNIPLTASDSNYQLLFKPDLVGTTHRVLAIWIFVALGFNIFHGFLPMFLKENGIAGNNAYLNFFIISLFGIPGSLAGMYLCETAIGRKGTMALATLGTVTSLLLFIMLKTAAGQLISASLESLLSNIMYGVIYTYTPEVFPTAVRGKGVGLASALGRLSGAVAPTLTGYLIQQSFSLPLYVSAGSLFFCFLCIVTLQIETRGENAK